MRESERKLKRVMIMGGMIQKSPKGDKVKVKVNSDAYAEYEMDRFFGRSREQERVERHNMDVISSLSGR